MGSEQKTPLLLDKPREVSVRGLVEGRAREISDLLAVINNASLPAGEVTQGKRTLMQRLPRHMRRRAMSHNVKRLPRRSQAMAEGLPMAKVVKKPPSRYHKRRPKRLTELYRKRQSKGPTWLETHIWHAKRFHVTPLWGYKLPNYSTARGFRASYRDSKSFCLVQDLSYFCCIQLEGNMNEILPPLSKITNPRTGKSFANKVAQNGGYEVEITVYRPNQYPYGCIGPVKFHWKPSLTNNETETRIAWIWAHPSIHGELVQVLCTIFSLNPQPPVDSVPTYEGGGVTVSLLKDTLIRLRFIGPESGSLLTEAYEFQPINDEDDTVTQREVNPPEMKEQIRFWNSLQLRSPAEFRGGTIFGGYISDPRFNRPKKRSSQFESLNFAKKESNLIHAPNHLDSPLWDPENRLKAGKLKKTDCEINIALADSLNSLPPVPQCVPFLLINQAKGCGRYGGWDLVLPEKWTMPFWLSAQFRTARAAGLRESRLLAFESATHSFPFEWPDTVAGTELETSQGQLVKEKYLRRPWNRRVDYDKKNVKHPFISPWLELIQGWNLHVFPDNSDLTEFYVLRDRSLLRILSKQKTGARVSMNSEDIEKHSNALIPVFIESIGKGFPKSKALICLPSDQDSLSAQIHEEIKKEEVIQTTEDDLGWLEEGIINLDKETELDLENLIDTAPAKKSKKRKRKKKPVGDGEAKIVKGISNRTTNVVDFASRKIIGFTTTGDVSFSSGKGRAIGFCSLLALVKLWEQQRENSNSFVLYRNLTSKVYRQATLRVLCDE